MEKYKFIIEILATCGFFKKVKFMPGTVGTLWGLPLAYVFSLAGILNYMVLSFLFIGFSIWVCHLYEQYSGEHDQSHVTIDEVAGFLVTMVWLPMTWQSLLAGFLLFRLLDILKPYPISYLDKKVKGGLGTVVDDLAAGLVSNIILQVIYTQTNWLGSQLSFPS